MRDFRKLQTWQKGHALALAVYQATRRFPREEIYGLTSQMRRAAVSIPTNIAEGCGRDTARDFLRFMHIAMGSASELEYLIQISQELGFLAESTGSTMAGLTTEVKRMLSSFINKLKADG